MQTFRVLLARPAFSALVILTVALGVGANTTIFSLVYGILLRPFPYPDSDRLSRVETRLSKTTGATRGASVYDLADWREQNRAFADLAGYISFQNNLEAPNGAQAVAMTMTTPALFSVLETRPLLGRTFTEEENRVGGDVLKAVLSHSLWQETFGADPQILGRTIRLRGASYSVIGVMPAGFQYPDRTEVWVPLQSRYAGYADDWWKHRDVRIHAVLGRLKPGMGAENAQADLQSVADGLARQFPTTNDGVQIRLTSLREMESGKLRPYVLLLGGAVLMMLLICCVNIANLLLARSVSREREMAVRAALGAGRWRIVKQLVAEGVVFGLPGGLLGSGVAFLGVRALLALIPVPLPPWMHIDVDLTALLFNFGLAVISAVLFSLAPALQLSKVDVNRALKEGTRGSSAGSGSLRDGLVVAEIALSLVLLVGAGAMMRSFLYLRNSDPGIDRQHLLAVRVGRFLTGMTNDQLAIALANDHRRLLDRAAELPGVIEVSGGDDFPYESHADERGRGEIYVLGQDEQQRKENGAVQSAEIAPGYFRVLGIPLLAGRDFTEADDVKTLRVAIISEHTAKTLFPGREAIGQKISWGKPSPNTPWTTVIGIVGDTKWHATERQKGFEVYFSYKQFAALPFNMLIRTAAEPSDLEPVVRRMIRDVNPQIAIQKVRTMDMVVTQALWERRLWGVLFLIFAILALALASIGLYGVMSYLVSQRTREIGIRMALGSSQSNVLGLVARHGITLVAIGIAIGLAAAFGLTRSIQSLIFGIAPNDPLTFATVALVLSTVALIACGVPAWRAARIDPILALRQE
jgi:putative ABC transport system permease protein